LVRANVVLKREDPQEKAGRVVLNRELGGEKKEKHVTPKTPVDVLLPVFAKRRKGAHIGVKGKKG